jgi:hypothetical protein
MRVSHPERNDALDRLAAVLDVRMPTLLEEVQKLLAADWPDYAQFIGDHHDEVAIAGPLFIHRLLDMAERGLTDSDPEPTDEETRQVFEQIGKHQFQLGLDVSDLLAAYQVGARAAWRHVAATALELELEPDVLAALAEAVFVFVDQFSAASTRGYVAEQSADSAARERRREELSELLLSGRSDNIDIRAAAERAGWPVPADALLVLAEPDDADARRLLERAERICLPVRRSDVFGVLVPDPTTGGRLGRLATGLAGAGVVVGLPVPLAVLPASMSIAQIALRLRRDGLLSGDPVWVAEHLDTILVHRDEWLIGVLRAQALRPLRDLSPASRARLVETLASWLRNSGDRQAVARELHIHPQTVRYRVGQLRERFGDQLVSPHARAKLFLALAWGPTGESADDR